MAILRQLLIEVRRHRGEADVDSLAVDGAGGSMTFEASSRAAPMHNTGLQSVDERLGVCGRREDDIFSTLTS